MIMFAQMVSMFKIDAFINGNCFSIWIRVIQRCTILHRDRIQNIICTRCNMKRLHVYQDYTRPDHMVSVTLLAECPLLLLSVCMCVCVRLKDLVDTSHTTRSNKACVRADLQSHLD